MEDRIPGGLQHHHKMCCKKGGHCGRQACMIWEWFYCRDIISRQMDLHMTTSHYVCSYEVATTVCHCALCNKLLN